VRLILHITERAAWQRARARGEYRPPSLTSEGFIHCSTVAQVVDTANRHYRGGHGLVLLCIDQDRLAAEVRYEAPPGSHDSAPGFPHIYGPLPVTAVVGIVDFPPGPDGTFTLPRGLERARSGARVIS
jgi:uncharacterized protein (DUF952 family)